MDVNERVLPLAEKRCQPCAGGIPPLDEARARELLAGWSGWELVDQGIEKTFSFRNYYQTLAFVNAVAYIAHAEDHHPVLTVSYRTCRVRYTTHAVSGLSENDFICAAKVERLVRP